ncbi:hypothetical protein ACGFNV_11670 [Streptomyces sp. NPDC048751]|uniref:hypothetical protein n=1 Tax=Streptomyces sp. NPDC048751 TaxID=3365591 RepID=UPI00371EB7EF
MGRQIPLPARVVPVLALRPAFPQPSSPPSDHVSAQLADIGAALAVVPHTRVRYDRVHP